MYCPVCFQDNLKIRSNGVVKLSFNGKSRNTSLFTYNVQKESHDELAAKLREKIVDFFSWYSEFKNIDPIKKFEAFSADFICTNGCKIDVINTRFSVIGSLYPVAEVAKILKEEGERWGIPVHVKLD